MESIWVRAVAAWSIWSLHMMILVWMIAGAFLPYPWAWWSVVILVPILEIHWATNDNRCILSDLEIALRGIKSDYDKGDGVFIRRIVEKLSGREPTDRCLNRTAHGVMVAVGLIGLGRIIISK